MGLSWRRRWNRLDWYWLRWPKMAAHRNSIWLRHLRKRAAEGRRLLQQDSRYDVLRKMHLLQKVTMPNAQVSAHGENRAASTRGRPARSCSTAILVQWSSS